MTWVRQTRDIIYRAKILPGKKEETLISGKLSNVKKSNTMKNRDTNASIHAVLGGSRAQNIFSKTENYS